MKNRIALFAILVLVASLITVSFTPSSVNAEIQDMVFKNYAFSMKPSYYDIVESISSEISLSENALSGLNLDNSDARKKIDNAWKIRGMAWSSHGDASEKLKQTELYLQNRQYKNSYNKLLDADKHLYNAKDDLYAIIKEIKNARDIEKQYQEDQRFCFWIWCSEIKNTYGILDTKIIELESKLTDIDNKLSKLEIENSSIVQSLHKYEISQQEKKIQQLEIQGKIQREQIRHEQLEADRQEQQLQAKIQQEQEKRQQERLAAELQEHRLQDDIREQEKQLELEEKASIRILARTNPVIQGLIDGTMYFYIEPIQPWYKVAGINNAVNDIADSLDRKFYGIDIRRTYDRSSADLTISWIKNYGGTVVGESLFKSIIKVGMGKDNCREDWQAFDTRTIKKIMWHEIGHSLGYSHSNDANNIMYESTKTQFSVDREYSFDMQSKSSHWFGFCNSGSIQYYAESTKDTDGFNAQIIPPDGDAEGFGSGKGLRYSDCGAENVRSLTRNCNIGSGSILHFYNYESHAIYITFQMFDKNSYHWPDMTWDQSEFEYSLGYMNKIYSMFH